MKRAFIFLTALGSLLCTRDSIAQTLTFKFKNDSLKAGPKFQYEVWIKSSDGTSKMGDIVVYNNYNKSGFGTFISGNGKVTVTKNSAVFDSLYSVPVVNDTYDSTFAFSWGYLGTTGSGVVISATDDGVLAFTVLINIADSSRSSGISFNPLMNGEQYKDNFTPWPSINIASTLNVPLVAAPPAPALVSPSDGATGVSTNPTLVWNSTIRAASYRLQVSTDLGFSTTVADISGITDTTRTVYGLPNNTTYYWHVSATNTGGTSPYSATQNFTAQVPLPATTSISPTSKTVGDGDFTMTVDGQYFDSTSVVRFNGSDRTTTFVDTTQLSTTIPASDLTVAGTFTITVFGPGGGLSNSQTFTVNNLVPTTTSISPTSKSTGDASFTLTVNGTNFVSSSVVRFNGSNRTTTFVNSTQLTASIPSSDLTVGGIDTITVFNPAPGGGTSNGQLLTVGNPAPTTTSISPTSKNVGSAGFTLTVNGTNFVTNSLVRFNGSDRTTTYGSSTQLTASIPQSDMATAGTFTITVFNPAPTGGTSNGQTFTVLNNVPTVSSISPTSKTVGDTAFTLTVNGTLFVSTSVVRFAGSTRTTTYISATQLTASIPASDLDTAGTFNITVFTPAPGGGTSVIPQAFTVNNPAPTLASIKPTSGNRLQTLDVGFKGSGFVNGFSSAGFGTNITVNSTTVQRSDSLTANITISATADTGLRNVQVTNPGPGGGTATLTNGFRVNNPPPTLTSINPTSGNRLQTMNVAFLGSGFISGVSSVSFGDSITVVSTAVNRSDSLTANITIKAGAAVGQRNVSVTNATPGGGTATLTNGFTVNNPAPALTSINPTSGNRLQTLSVGFKGSGFISGVSSVNVGDSITVNTTTVNRSDSLTANITIRAGAATGARDFTVTNSGPGGGTSGNVSFSVNNPAPTLSSINPASGNRLQTLSVGFKGSGFISGVSSVNVGDSITVNTTTVNRSDSLTANITIKAGAALGGRNFSVTNSGPGGGTSVNVSFTVSNPAPTLVSLNPTSGNLLQTLNVGFTGSGFITGVSSVNVGDSIVVNSTTVNRSDSLTANITIKVGAALGTRSFTVTNSAPGGGTSGSQSFSVENPVPTITSISPISKQAGDSAFTLTVDGTNFLSSSVVQFNSSNRTTTFLGATQLTAAIPASDIAVEGTDTIRVFNPAPGGGTSNSQLFFVGPPPSVVVNTKVFLQGPFSSGSMRITLRDSGFIPLNHPYSGSPWNYTGTEHVASIPANVVDWILVELRTGTTSASWVATRAAFLKSDGSVVDTSGSGPVKFVGRPAGNYYVVLRQRNHLAVMSANAVALSDTSSLYDFTTSGSQSYGSGGLVQVSTIWAMWAGDVNSNGQLKYSGAGNDRALILTRIGGTDITATVSGYYKEDVNMNGVVKYSGSGNDRAIILTNIGGTDITATKNTQVPN